MIKASKLQNIIKVMLVSAMLQLAGQSGRALLSPGPCMKRARRIASVSSTRGALPRSWTAPHGRDCPCLGREQGIRQEKGQFNSGHGLEAIPFPLSTWQSVSSSACVRGHQLKRHRSFEMSKVKCGDASSSRKTLRMWMPCGGTRVRSSCSDPPWPSTR